jgi:hypothetical protein
VLGCGLILNPENKLAVFFTKNGTLMGQFGLELAKIFILNISVNLQVRKFRSVFLLWIWIVSIQLWKFMMHGRRPILGETRPNLSSLTLRNAPDWTWSEN